MVLFLVEEHVTDEILHTLLQNCRLQEPGVGMACVNPIDQVVGMDSQMMILYEQSRDQYF